MGPACVRSRMLWTAAQSPPSPSCLAVHMPCLVIRPDSVEPPGELTASWLSPQQNTSRLLATCAVIVQREAVADDLALPAVGHGVLLHRHHYTAPGTLVLDVHLSWY